MSGGDEGSSVIFPTEELFEDEKENGGGGGGRARRRLHVIKSSSTSKRRKLDLTGGATKGRSPLLEKLGKVSSVFNVASLGGKTTVAVDRKRTARTA